MNEHLSETPKVSKNNEAMEKMPDFEKDYPIPPKTWLTQAILVTIIFAWPFGIPAIYYALKTKKFIKEENYEFAEIASSKAARWTNAAFFIGLVFWILALVKFL